MLSVLLAQFLAQSAPAALQLQGAGATFPAPLYLRWIAEYTKAHPGVQINYQAIGSGAGIKQFTQNLVAFGASDAAMTDKEIAAVKRGVVLIPATAGSIVLAYNLPGVEDLNGGFFLLSPQVSDLIAGDMTVWEQEPMETLARQQELRAYVHKGFWHPMDTLRDRTFLESEWSRGAAKWKLW